MGILNYAPLSMPVAPWPAFFAARNFGDYPVSMVAKIIVTLVIDYFSIMVAIQFD